MTRRTPLTLIGLGLALTGAMAAPPGTFTLRIAVDQFGYSPDLTKVAVISNPQTGFNAGQTYTPGGTLQVRTWPGSAVVFSGTPVAWNNGATHAQSGDRAWWFDFSTVKMWGQYYVYDPAHDACSARFRIGQDVYEDVLKQAMRMFYYQRRGIAKVAPYAEPLWTDGTSYMGPLQDTHCRLVSNPVLATEKDLRGGWFDAGDYNKYERDNMRLRAAVFLYDITGQSAYRTYVESNYGNVHGIAWSWWNFYDSAVQDALLYFSTLAGVTPSVAATIRTCKQASMNGSDYLGAWTSGKDAYQAYLPDADYIWGSNQVKCHSGMLYDAQVNYGLDTANAAVYRAAAAGYVHYLHGVNPLTMVYLSNMYQHGATNCVKQFYHTWFGDGTIYDDALTSPNGPAPGYLTGGANPTFVQNAAYTGPRLAPPLDQPIQKSYKDWNGSWPEDSWQITEPGIYYQAAYVLLLSRFVHPLSYQDWATGYGLTGTAADPLANPSGDGVANLVKYAFNLSPLVNGRSSMPQFSLQHQSVNGVEGTYLTAQFPRQLGQSNLTCILEGSADLTHWSPLCTAAGTDPASGTGFLSETGTGYRRQVLACDTVARENAPTPRFVRFHLVLN